MDTKSVADFITKYGKSYNPNEDKYPVFLLIETLTMLLRHPLFTMFICIG